jgi:hypothetical protein
MRNLSWRNGHPMENSLSYRRGWFRVLKTLLLWLVVLAGCTGLFGLFIEWMRSITLISAP